MIDMEIYSNANTILVTWRVKKSKDRYFVIDLLVADISLVVTKRSEFNSMLKTVDYNLASFNEKLGNQNDAKDITNDPRSMQKYAPNIAKIIQN